MTKIFDKNNKNYVEFNERYFTFKLNGTTRLKSVTKFIKTFFQEFDKDGISAAYAKKHGMTQQEVIDMWDAKAKRSTEIGNAVHKFIENYYKKESFDTSVYDETILKYIDSAKKAIEQISQVYDFVEAEKIVFDPENKYAGILDAIMKGKKSGKIYLIDWKTNETIKTENPFQSGFEPISHIEDCNFNHYSLQLNLLKKALLNHIDINPDDIIMQLVHITADDVCYHSVPDFSKELEDMFNSDLLKAA